MNEDEVQQEVEPLRHFAELVGQDEETTAVEADPDDDKSFEAAVAGNVDHVGSGDQHLIELGSFRGIEIVHPRTFYEQFECGRDE